MASGGNKPKMSASEPRGRSGWQRTTSVSDKEDNISLSSMPNELRPNNWDFSDWRPSANTDQTKRRKKGNPEWEREQSLTQDSPPPSEHRHGTPRTFPRTKITPSTPTATRQALENLRQQLTFSDQEEAVSNDGERNNDRNLLRRGETVRRYQLNAGVEGPLRPVANQRDDRNNRNNNKQNQNEMKSEEKPGSSLMVSRLMQIRGYIKQASSMMDSLCKSGDPPGYRDEIERLQKLMDHLKEQERNCTTLLQNSLSLRDENGMNDMVRDLSPNPDPLEETTSIDLDMQSEVSDREERSASATSASLRPRIEDRLGLTPDLDLNDDDEEEEEEVEEELDQSDSSDNSGTMDDTVIAGQRNRDPEMGLMEEELAAGGFQNPKEAAETLVALRQQQELLTKLVEQQEQMRALRDRQSALLAMQQDAEAKLASARQKSNQARGTSESLDEAARTMSARAEALFNMESNAGRQTDPTLNDIRQQLQYLRNELKSQVGANELNAQSSESSGVNLTGSQSDRRADKAPVRSHPQRPPSPRVAERLAAAMNFPPRSAPGAPAQSKDMSHEQMQAHLKELLSKRDQLDQLLADEFSAPLLTVPAEDMNQTQLQNKLKDLQRKKARMDTMLQEIQSLRTSPALTLNNGSAPTSHAASGAIQPQASSAAKGPAKGNDTALASAEAKQKLQKLNEVKERLNSLKSLVQYYRSVEDGQGQDGDGEDQSFLPVYSDYDVDQEPTRDRGLQNIPMQESRSTREGLVKQPQNIPVQVAPDQDESDENNSSTDSDTDSQLSSLGPWGDDPEIQEKVKKLKSAKEKLKRLQNLVAMVQNAPDDAEDQPSGPDRNNASTSEGEVPDQPERDLYYQSKMQEQLTELDQLKEEKERLLAIQSQLQTLHDRFQQGEQVDVDLEDEDEEDVRPQPAAARPKSQNKQQQNNQQQQQQQQHQQSSGPSVTFSSNEEVYDKMRKQRMMREELRDKKKQLESIMKKDGNRKQYYKNQDNQSDTVSYSTEPFGATASVDATMATWGGSTVDNLESITEDGAPDPQDNEGDEEDDAYPSDGILQVEEEEEENQSDNETYTIEEDVRQRRKARAMQKETSDLTMRKTKRTFPRARSGGARPKEAWTRQDQPDFNKWSRNNRKSRQENYRSAEDILQENETGPSQNHTLEELQKQLEQMSVLCQTLLENQSAPQLARQSAAGFGSHTQLMPDLQQQLQQQQLMMSLNQCYQQISMQQMEMQNMQRQMQSMFYQFTDNSELNDSNMMPDPRARSLQPPLFSPLLARQSPSLMLPTETFQFNPIYHHLSPSARLLRRAEPDNAFGRIDQSEMGERQRNMSTRSSRSSRSELYSQKKKSLSPPQMASGSTKFKSSVNQSYAEEEEEEEEEKDEENVGYESDRPMTAAQFEQYLARKKREFFERNNLTDSSSKKPASLDSTGVRRSSKSRTDDNQLYRPGLSAGISGAGYQEDGRSVTSSVMSSVAAKAQAMSAQSDTRDARDSDDPNEISLFETLRESIYSEVATLISQNENRPHYLIELFRELQLLTTDYLRQRVLYDIKDVVSKFLVEENSVTAPPPPWMNATSGHYNQSELTPSESIVTSDEEDVKYLMQAKLKQKVAANLVAKEQRKKLGKSVGLMRSGSLKNDTYDYQEPAEEDSTVSTPSNSYWDSPFNQDSLGDTVIHLDKTMEKMREYEKKLAAKDAKVKNAVERLRRMESADGCSSSAMDQGSESSVTSDTVPYPRINTQQLDQQIKSIMTEVIPVIKEHMDNMCSPQLLAYIKRLVLSLTRQYGGGQEFARFFHRQLGSILQDTLAKYEGRKMRECGEDLLVDMSEVLFNELAFFRLMQDLDDPLIAEKLQRAQVGELESQKDEEKEKEAYEESDTTESTANASDNPDQEDDQEDEMKATQTEEEDLGKARDDALANEMEMQDADDKDDDTESPFKGVQIELAPSETKPYTRIGSDEDDESATDESQSNEDPSETAVSINARRKNYSEDFEDDGTNEALDQDDMGDMGESSYHMVTEDQTQDADQGASSVGQHTEHMNGDILNGLNGDIEVITMDDLPASLTVMSSEELQQKVLQEQQQNIGAAIVLDTMDGQQELAGDPQHLRDPGETSC